MIRRRLALITGGAAALPLVVLFGLNAVDELDRTAFNVLLPDIRDAFHLSNQGILTLVGAVGIVALLLQVPIAYYADRSPRVRIALAGAGVWAFFCLLTGVAPTLAVLAVARVGSGMGKAVVDPTHNSLIADYYDVSVRTQVYGVHRAANAVGSFVGPLVAGLVAYAIGWRAPFVLFAVPTAVFVVLGLRLREPRRGVHERRAAGASEETALTEELPPSLAESWRIVWAVASLRRIWYSLPFLATAVIGLYSLVSLYYEHVFHLDERARGFVAAAAEPAQLFGLLIGIPIATRLLARDPGLVLRFLGVVAVVTAAAWTVFAITPVLGLAIAMNVVISGVIAVLAPGIFAALSLAIPPRARSLGFSVAALWILPGVAALGIVGRVADTVSVRAGLLMLAPLFLIGGFVLASGASLIGADIRRVWTSAAAQSEVLAAHRRGEVKLLLVRGLDVAYNGVQVLFGVDFEVAEGEIVALLGTNGAGKSTLLKAISGLVEARGGAVVFEGRDMTYAPPHEIVARGVVQVPGGKGVFPSLTVGENLRLAGWLHRRDAERTQQAATRVLEIFPVLRDRLDEPAGNLSGGQQQMLTLGMAFVSRPRLLMIDELSLGLAPVVVEQLLAILRDIRASGTTVILVEQSVNLALTVAETAYFMEKGEIRFRGPTADLLDRPDILRAVFLAEASDNGQRAPRTGEGRPVLEVEQLSKRYGGIDAVRDVSFSLGDGEILGVIGPNGAGKTTLFDLVSGFAVADAGRIVVDGRDVTRLPAHRRAQLGLGRSFQDARLFPALTVGETIAVAFERRVEVRDPLAAALNMPAVADSEARVAAWVEQVVDVMGLGAFRDKFVYELSTGSRRIVDLACVLAHRPRVLLLDEPSSGIAQREAEALGPLLLRIREATGASILVIEHDVPLVSSVADRLMALDLGRVIAVGAPADVVDDPRVVASYLGGAQDVVARSGAFISNP